MRIIIQFFQAPVASRDFVPHSLPAGRKIGQLKRYSEADTIDYSLLRSTHTRARRILGWAYAQCFSRLSMRGSVFFGGCSNARQCGKPNRCPQRVVLTYKSSLRWNLTSPASNPSFAKPFVHCQKDFGCALTCKSLENFYLRARAKTPKLM